jgi:hypothetical protein
MATVIYRLEGDPDPIQISNRPAPEQILKYNLFLFKDGRYHPVSSVHTEAGEADITFSSETLPRKPEGDNVRILVFGRDF